MYMYIYIYILFLPQLDPRVILHFITTISPNSNIMSTQHIFVDEIKLSDDTEVTSNLKFKIPRASDMA